MIEQGIKSRSNFGKIGRGGFAVAQRAFHDVITKLAVCSLHNSGLTISARSLERVTRAGLMIGVAFNPYI